MQTSSLTRYESVFLPSDGRDLLSILSRDEVTGLRVWQDGEMKRELHHGHWSGGDEAALSELLARAGADPSAVMDVEVFVRESGAGIRESGFGFLRPGGAVVDLAGLHAGGTVFLCLNGPSFDENVRRLLSERPGVVTFCVNNGGHGFRPDLWTCVDAASRFMPSIWEDGRVMKFVPVEFFSKPFVKGGEGRVADCPNVWGYRRNERFRAGRFLTERTVNWGNHKKHGGGRSVMLAAIRIAWELGFRRVVLTGCDFHMSEEVRYWFAEGRTKQAIRNNLSTYERLRGYFKELLPVFRRAGLTVVNATPGSRLDVFPRVRLTEELIRLDVDTAATTEGMYAA